VIGLILADRREWWAIPKESFLMAALISISLVIPVLRHLFRMDQRVVRTHKILIVLHASVAFVYFVSRLQMSMGILLLLLLQVGYWVHLLLEREFLRPMWWQAPDFISGLPSAIPQLKAEIFSTLEPKLPLQFQVASLDREGACVLSANDHPPELQSTGSIVLHYGDHQIKSPMTWVHTSENGRVLGIQFRPETPDQRKELYDFVEILRARGHVEVR
jgi:hypothetical protein